MQFKFCLWIVECVYVERAKFTDIPMTVHKKYIFLIVERLKVDDNVSNNKALWW
jgi:hypothetical protein